MFTSKKGLSWTVCPFISISSSFSPVNTLYTSIHRFSLPSPELYLSYPNLHRTPRIIVLLSVHVPVSSFFDPPTRSITLKRRREKSTKDKYIYFIFRSKSRLPFQSLFRNLQSTLPLPHCICRSPHPLSYLIPWCIFRNHSRVNFNHYLDFTPVGYINTQKEVNVSGYPTVKSSLPLNLNWYQY